MVRRVIFKGFKKLHDFMCNFYKTLIIFVVVFIVICYLMINMKVCEFEIISSTVKCLSS